VEFADNLSRHTLRTLRRPGVVAAGIGLLVFASHSISKNYTPFDSYWVLPVSLSILRHGDVNLDEYASTRLPKPPVAHALHRVGEHTYNAFPLGPSLIALPTVAARQVLAWVRGQDLEQRWGGGGIRFRRAEKMTASLVIALAAVMLFFIGREMTGRTTVAAAASLVFAFCTSAWSTASRALWQHGPSMLMLCVALWLLLVARRRPRVAQFVTLPLAAAYVIRPTNAISIAVLGLYLLIRHRRYVLPAVAWALLVAVPFVAYSLTVYDHVLPWYFRAARLGMHPAFWEALAGNLVSPARGLFVFSPILLLSTAGVWVKVRRRQFTLLDAALILAIVLHWVAISAFGHWWAGHSFGPRFFSDMLPYFAYFLVPAFAAIAEAAPKRRTALTAAAAVLAAFSFVVHFRGANFHSTLEWNAGPGDIDRHPERLWDWSDLQFFR
jgi:hypothetical protein